MVLLEVRMSGDLDPLALKAIESSRMVLMMLESVAVAVILLFLR